MLTKHITVDLPANQESRPVALLVQVASQYDSTIYLQCADKKVNAKSIMGMMTLGLCSGDKVTAIIEGIDEQAAMEDIEKYLSSQNE